MKKSFIVVILLLLVIPNMKVNAVEIMQDNYVENMYIYVHNDKHTPGEIIDEYFVLYPKKTSDNVYIYSLDVLKNIDTRDEYVLSEKQDNNFNLETLEKKKK